MEHQLRRAAPRHSGSKWLAFVALACGAVALRCSASESGSEATVRVVGAADPVQTPAASGTPAAPVGTAPSGASGEAPGATDFLGDEPPSTAPAACSPVSCSSPGGQYCGRIADGCGAAQDCGGCAPGWQCADGICVGDASCVRRSSCSVTGATYCGVIGDGCGGSLECGGCDAGQLCQGGVCVPPGCVPATCETAAGRFCGTIGDGCGGSLECGGCPGGGVCGGGGIAGLCAPANCTPLSCNAGSGRYCGSIGNGCGGVLDCGGCPNAGVCGGDGSPNVCPGAAACTGLSCQVGRDNCAATTPTRLRGVAFDPAANLPLYNVSVYVPNAPLDAIADGARCETCDATLSGQPIATALSGVDGSFELRGVPSGQNIPLVLQIGRWRRQVVIPTVRPCADNVITDRNLTRLPRNRNEGHIPRMAVATGGSDALECLLHRIGLDDSEFTSDTGPGRVHMYFGRNGTQSLASGGPQFGTAVSLWSNQQKLLGYDLVVLSCEGGQQPEEKQPYIANIEGYLNAGGRAFLSHLHYYWLRMGTPGLRGTAVYNSPGDNLAETVGVINQTFPKGQALADWLVAVNASTVRGQLPIAGGQESVAAVVPPTQSWITLPAFGNVVEYLTFNTPLAAPAAQQCGRTVLTDIHIQARIEGPNGDEGGDDSDTDKPFPTGCSDNPSSPQAKALEFMFFDLSACVQPDDVTPVAPPPALPPVPNAPVAAPPPPAPPPPALPPPPVR